MIKLIKNQLNLNFLVKGLLIPLILLFLYSLIFAFIYSQFLPKGVNFDFVNRLWKTLTIPIGLLAVIILIYSLIRPKEKLLWNLKHEKFPLSDLLLLIFPLTPIFQYIITNRAILSYRESSWIILIFIILSAILVIFLPYIFRKFSYLSILKMLGLAFIFTISSMAMLSKYFKWYDAGSLKIQLGYIFIVFLILWLLYVLNFKTFIFLYIIANFIISIILPYFGQSPVLVSNQINNNEPELIANLRGRELVSKPNIYLLIYDSYVANETIISYGLDNSKQEKFLQDRGFVLYPHTYTVGTHTLETMSRVLDASTNFIGHSRKAVSGNGVVQNILKSHGYITYGIFPYDFMFRGVGSSYDYSIPSPTEIENLSFKILLSAILMGEFRFDNGFDEITRAQFLEAKKTVFTEKHDSSIFVYMHSKLPGHSQNSGSCLPNEKELFLEALTLANNEMKDDIENIIAQDPGAIMIIAGDHGPSLTKNCTTTSSDYKISDITRLDIQDRYGAFLAIRWPSGIYGNYDDITVLQDVFPAIFAYLFEDKSLLDYKIDSTTLNQDNISGAFVQDGIINGGVNDGEPLFLMGK